MNNPYKPRTSNAWNRRTMRPGASALPKCLIGLLFTILLSAGFTGCSFLKPAKSAARHFVLTPTSAVESATAASAFGAVGVGQVKLPAYLFNTSLAVRHGTNEIEYLPTALWAERVDKGSQRVLAANLGILLPTDQVRLSSWNREDVSAEVYVTIEQFDVDTNGHGVLAAQWRVCSPGGERILKAGECRLTEQGASPNTNPAGAVATLSELMADLSHQLAQVLQEAASGQATPGR